MVTPDQIQRHYRVYHIQGPTKRARLSPPTADSIESDVPPVFHQESVSMNHPVPTLSFTNFSREASSEFYKNEQDGLGAAYLVGYSSFHQKDLAPNLDKDEVELIILVSSLASTLSRGERAKLSICFSKLLATQ